MNKSDVAKVYNTLMCTPGMSEVVKVDLRIKCSTVLLLAQVINKGLNSKPGEDPTGLLDITSKEGIKELEDLVSSCLEKAKLTELIGMLQQLHSS